MTGASSQVRVAAVALCSSLALGGGRPTLVAAQARPAAAPRGAEAAHFRVDMHIDQDGERYVIRQYVDGARSRMETEFEGEKFIVIQLGDGPGTTYTLMPESRMAMKMTQQAAAPVSGAVRESMPAGASAGAGQGDAAMELVGTETIEGLTAHKYRVRMPNVDGWVWLDANSQQPLRMEAGGAVVALRNYDFSKPPDDMFQVPKGYAVTDAK